MEGGGRQQRSGQRPVDRRRAGGDARPPGTAAARAGAPVTSRLERRVCTGFHCKRHGTGTKRAGKAGTEGGGRRCARAGGCELRRSGRRRALAARPPSVHASAQPRSRADASKGGDPARPPLPVSRRPSAPSPAPRSSPPALPRRRRRAAVASVLRSARRPPTTAASTTPRRCIAPKRRRASTGEWLHSPPLRAFAFLPSSSLPSTPPSPTSRDRRYRGLRAQAARGTRSLPERSVHLPQSSRPLRTFSNSGCGSRRSVARVRRRRRAARGGEGGGEARSGARQSFRLDIPARKRDRRRRSGRSRGHRCGRRRRRRS